MEGHAGMREQVILLHELCMQEIQRLQAQINDFKTRIDGLQGAIDRLKLVIEGLNERATQLRISIMCFKAACEMVRADVRRLDERVMERLDRIEARLDALPNPNVLAARLNGIERCILEM